MSRVTMFPVSIPKGTAEPKGMHRTVEQVDGETGRVYHQPLFYPGERYRKLPATGRGIKGYVRYLGIDIDTLRGLRVLDIGSGVGVFGHECRAQNIHVVDLDPIYTQKRRRELEPTLTPPHFVTALRDSPAKVAATNEHLPFRGESFNVVLSCYGSLFWAPLDRDIPTTVKVVDLMLKETTRVLKPGGVAYLSFEKDDKDWAVLSELLFDRRRWRSACWELHTTHVPVLKIVKRG